MKICCPRESWIRAGEEKFFCVFKKMRWIYNSGAPGRENEMVLFLIWLTHKSTIWSEETILLTFSKDWYTMTQMEHYINASQIRVWVS